jgi:C1A family cysteine protease
MMLILSVLLIGAIIATVADIPAAADTSNGVAKPVAIPPSVDLRSKLEHWDLPGRRQGPRGTCSVFTVTGALEYAAAQKQGHGTRFSVEFLNWAGHAAANRTADGGFFSELWKGFERYGICPEVDQPYQADYNAALQPAPEALKHATATRSLGLKLHWIKEWNPHTGLTEEHMREIKATLANQWPVCGGFRWPKKAHWTEHVLQMCPPEDVFDGHSVLLVGYRDDPAQPGGGVFLIRNSGGDGSDGFLPYAYVSAYMNDACWISGG